MNKDQKILAEKYNQVLLEYDDKTYVLVLFYDHKGYTSNKVYYKIVPKEELRQKEKEDMQRIGWSFNGRNSTRISQRDTYDEGTIKYVQGTKWGVESEFLRMRGNDEENGYDYIPMIKLDKETEQAWGDIIDEI
jgi:hypothetical protein